jgi:sodium-dependent dicarboxylate transporter 2/3/5
LSGRRPHPAQEQSGAEHSEPLQITGEASAPGSAHDADDPVEGKRSKLVGLVVGPLLLVAIVLSPMPLSQEQQALAAVLVFAVTYWISEALPIPVTSLLALALCVVLDVAPGQGNTARLVFSEFASPLLFLLIGGFVIAQAMLKYNLTRRIALRVLSLHGVDSTYEIVIVFGALGVLLASVVDNGAVAAMLLPVALGLNEELSKPIRDLCDEPAAAPHLGFSAALMLMTAYGPTVGALLTPFGDASNLLGRQYIEREVGVRISFTQWVVVAAPVVLTLFAVMCVVVLALNRPEVRRIPGTRRFVQAERRELSRMSRGEINTLIAFAAAVILWLLPTIVGVVAGRLSPAHRLVIDRVPPEVAAVLAATLLFVLPVNWRLRRFTLTWEDAQRIDWGTILLVGSGVTLGSLMASTGLADLIGESLAGSLSGSPLLVYLAIAGLSILLSELTSNLASIGIILPLVPAMTAAGGGDTLTAALIATFATKYGFMLPISTSANAIVYGSGQLPITRMIRTGVVVDLSAILIIVVGVTVMLRVAGLR